MILTLFSGRPPRFGMPSVEFDSTSLHVEVASPEYLLAMKLFASRPENDLEDIAFLYRLLGFTTVEEGLDLLESFYHSRPIELKTQYFLADIVESLAAERLDDEATNDVGEENE